MTNNIEMEQNVPQEHNPEIEVNKLKEAVYRNKNSILLHAINLKGKKYLQVEGWQFIANLAGKHPSNDGVITEIKDENGIVIGFEAIGVLNDERTGREIGRSNGAFYFRDHKDKQGNIKEMPMFASRAMAQTRAVSRVVRSKYAWVLKDIGVEATPYEEMNGLNLTSIPSNSPSPTPNTNDTPPSSPKSYNTPQTESVNETKKEFEKIKEEFFKRYKKIMDNINLPFNDEDKNRIDDLTKAHKNLSTPGFVIKNYPKAIERIESLNTSAAIVGLSITDYLQKEKEPS